MERAMKFSIRDIMLVTVIVALAVAWWIDRSRLREQLQKLEILRQDMEVRRWFDDVSQTFGGWRRLP
jgi:hypothetical protein